MLKLKMKMMSLKMGLNMLRTIVYWILGKLTENLRVKILMLMKMKKLVWIEKEYLRKLLTWMKRMIRIVSLKLISQRMNLHGRAVRSILLMKIQLSNLR